MISLAGVYYIIALLSSVPFFARHLMGGLAPPVYAMLLAVLLGAWFFVRARGLVVAGLAIVVLAIANFREYPKLRLVAHPSSAPEALRVPFARLLHGLEPYGERLFDGAPISPGPGWILLHGGFTALGLIPLIVPFWLGLATFMMARRGASPALFVALVCAPLAFLQMSLVGHDIFAISLAFVVVTLAASGLAGRGRWLVIVAIFAGTIATARLPLILLPPVIGLGLARRGDRAAGVRFGLISVATALLWHGGFWLWCVHDGDFYQPTHLFSRAHAGAGVWFSMVGAAGGVAAAVWIWRRSGGEAADTLFALWLLQTALFLPIGVGELVNAQHFDWANWEGKNYVAYPLPLLAAAMALPRARDGARLEN